MNIRKRYFITLFLLILFSFHSKLFAQETKSKSILIDLGGIVNDSATNAPIGGAMIHVRGSKRTENVNENGIFHLTRIPSDAMLEISMVGYNTKVIALNGADSVLVVLSALPSSMENVVVTALGIKRTNRALGYATQKIGGDAVQAVKGVDIGTSLSGMVAGLRINNSTEFNAQPTIQLRGETPLLVIDGVPYGNMTLRDIPTDNIESMDVLKGPTAAALYGNRGSAGAIMITTKKGFGNGLRIDVNSSNMAALGYIAIPKVQSSYGHGLNGKIADDYVWGPKLDIGTTASQWNPITKQMETMPLVSSGKNNLKNFMGTGVISNTGISLTQTGENGFFRTGLNYIYNKGQFPNSTLKIINYTLSGQLRVGKKFDLNSNMGYTRQTSPQNWGRGYNSQGYLYQILMWTGPDYDIRQYKDYWVKPNEKQNWLYNSWYDNPYLIANEKLEGLEQNKMYASLTANYSFTKDIKLMFRTGYDYYNTLMTVRNPMNINSTRGSDIASELGSDYGFANFSWNWNAAGMYGQDQVSGYSTNNDLILTYDKKINKFHFNVLGGGSIYYYNNKEAGAVTANGLSVPGWYSLANATASTTVGVNSIKNNYSNYKRQVNSLYGKASVSYNDLAYIDLTGRNDWSSTQKADERSYFYPSVASSVIMSEFIKMPSFISMWKLRGSWTLDKTPAGVYDNNRNFSLGTSMGLVTSNYPSSLQDADLKPSTARTWEVGTAVALFGRRVNVDIAYFNKYYYNQQKNIDVSNASGYSKTLINWDETYVRRGLEVTMDGTVIRNDKFKWSTIVNYSFDHNYLVDLDPLYSSDNLWTKKGERMDVYTAKKYLRDNAGNIINNNGIPLQSNYPSKLGTTDPSFSFGFINNFSLGNFTLGVNIDGRIGGLMYNYIWNKMWDTGSQPETDNQYRYDEVVNGLKNFVAPGSKVISGSVSYDKYGNITNDTRTFAKNDDAVSYQAYARALGGGGGEHGVMKKTFVKLRQVAFGYNIPSSIISKYGIKDASVSIIGQNLLLFTGFKFADPDVNTENMNAPAQRMVGIDVKIGF